MSRVFAKVTIYPSRTGERTTYWGTEGPEGYQHVSKAEPSSGSTNHRNRMTRIVNNHIV